MLIFRFVYKDQFHIENQEVKMSSLTFFKGHISKMLILGIGN
jgi:hypothetical protein